MFIVQIWKIWIYTCLFLVSWNIFLLLYSYFSQDIKNTFLLQVVLHVYAGIHTFSPGRSVGVKRIILFLGGGPMYIFENFTNFTSE